MFYLQNSIQYSFKNENVDEAYRNYSNFISFNKKDGMNMTDYILEFEHLYRKMMECNMKLHDVDFTFKLLRWCKYN